MTQNKDNTNSRTVDMIMSIDDVHNADLDDNIDLRFLFKWFN